MQKINEIISLLLGSFLVLVACFGTAQAQEDPVAKRLEKRSAEVREQFQDVRHISPEDFLALEQTPLLIDVREADEYAVSRLPDARHADNETTLLALAEQAGDRPVVVYCSLGVRSSRAAQLLRENGYTNVANLDGSLFRWANEGRALENAAGPTELAHPFNLWWGRYLRRELHARQPRLEDADQE
ncbi:MAG: rhodanese-like domain-containing protein [Pseudomonadota bacterium]